MKRFIVLSIVLVLVAGVCFAGDTIALNKYTYIIPNSSGTYKTTVIPTTSIRPGTDKYTGFDMGALDPTISSEMVYGIYDNASTACNGEVIAEGENNTQFQDKWEREIVPRKLINGVTVIQGPNTRVKIHFIRE